jgi:hypothetical protein
MSSTVLRRVVLQKLTDVSEVIVASVVMVMVIITLMKAVKPLKHRSVSTRLHDAITQKADILISDC